MPLLPVGAKVWLSDNPPNGNTQRALQYYDPPQSISVRDREGGTLLFGAARDDFDTVASPVRIGAPSDDCTGPNPGASSCSASPTITYEAIEIEGDTPVVVHDSQPGRISLGGVDYDVRLAARRLSERTGFNCGNQDGTALDIQAVDLATLAAALDTGTGP